jgi:hypothetical membrane protein
MNRLALGGLFGPVVFSAVVILAAALRADYSHATQFISELGATGSSRASLMNFAGFVPGGSGLIAFGVALGRILPRSPLTRTAASLLVVFGSGVAASGIISCDPGCPQTGGSLANSVHDKIAPLSFLCAIAASCLLSFSFRRDSAWRSVSFYSLATSVVGLGFLMLLVNSLESRALTGLWQRLLLVALFSWCAVIGVKAYRQSTPPQKSV